MKRVFLTVWAAVCALCGSMAGVCLASASEQTSTAAENAEKVLLTMDVFQTVSLVIVITAVVLFVAFYAVKAVLKKLHVEPENRDREEK